MSARNIAAGVVGRRRRLRVAVAASLFLGCLHSFASLAGAQVDHGELFLFSSESDRGQLLVSFPFAGKVGVEESACVNGSCLYVATTPGIVTDDEGQEVPNGAGLLGPGTPVSVTIASLDPGASLKIGSVLLDDVGDFVRLGLSPFHAHVSFQVIAPEDQVGTWRMGLRFSSSAPSYTDSVVHVVELTNEPVVATTTTSTTSTTLSVCGDGALGAGEDCDDGDSDWQSGSYCRADCSLVACGDPDDSGKTLAGDALYSLRAAVGAVFCDLCVCDVDASGSVTASDALRLLRMAVGDAAAFLECSDCP